MILAVNVEAVQVANCLPANCPSGVLCSEDNLVWAFWLSYLGDRHSSADVEFYNGLPTPYLEPIISQLRRGETPNLRILGCEFHSIELSNARSRGVSDEWIQKVEKANDERHAFFMVRRLDATEHDVEKKINGEDKRILQEGILPIEV
jgi:pro-apoptotic serine protease NMA111